MNEIFYESYIWDLWEEISVLCTFKKIQLRDIATGIKETPCSFIYEFTL